MTREIAINRIREIERCTPIHTEDDVKDCKALEMAISALEMNVPCSLCRFRYDNSGLCAKCPAMPIGRERI